MKVFGDHTKEFCVQVIREVHSKLHLGLRSNKFYKLKFADSSNSPQFEICPPVSGLITTAFISHLPHCKKSLNDLCASTPLLHSTASDCFKI